MLPITIPLDSATLTSTTFLSLSASGVLLPVSELPGKVRARFGMQLKAPASNTVEVRLSYQAGDAGLFPIPRLVLRHASPQWTKLVSEDVDVTQFVRKEAVFALRLEGRVTGGTAHLATPFLVLTTG